MKEIILNGRLLTTKNRMYDQFDEVFDLPEYFGNNLDALWDVLNETSEPMTIHFTYVTKFLEETGTYGESVLRFFRELEEKNKHVKVYYYLKDYEKEMEE